VAACGGRGQAALLISNAFMAASLLAGYMLRTQMKCEALVDHGYG